LRLSAVYLLLVGIALLLAGLFFDSGAARARLQTATPAPTSLPVGTPDRLAQPTLPASPSQADLGSQAYWLSCLPCHGDVGQGLTDEFRETYPAEDQYCWESGCHGKNPYESGFTLPKTIPAVVGPGALQKYANAAQLNAYIRAAMPYWDPGSLTEDEAWKITAFLLRENGLWDAREEINASNADRIPVHEPEPESTLEADSPPAGIPPYGAAILVFVLLVSGILLSRLRRNPQI